MTDYQRLSDITYARDRDSRASTFIEFARALAASGKGHGALDFLEQQHGSRSPQVEGVKAAVLPHTTADPSALSSERLGDAFLKLTRQR